MLLGVILVLLATAAQNGSVVLLAVAARGRPEHSGPSLLVAVGRHLPGLAGMALNTGGWVLELLALRRISLTLDRILMTSGFALLLWLARRELQEPVDRREVAGVAAIAVGIAAVAFMPIGRGAAPITLGRWALMAVIFAPIIVAPFAVQRLDRRTPALLASVAAGMCYAVTGIVTKEMADLLGSKAVAEFALLLLVIAVIDTLGFMDELIALQEGAATMVVPVFSALRIVVPVALAPVFFAETWPRVPVEQAVIVGGILCNLIGVVILSRASAHLVAATRK